MSYVEETQRLFGERMRYYRKQRGLTLDDVARKLGTTVSSMSRIENGKQNLSMAYIATIAETLEVPVLALFGGDGWENSSSPSTPLAPHYHQIMAMLDGLTREMTSLGDSFMCATKDLTNATQPKHAYSPRKYSPLYQNVRILVPQLSYA